ncbi:MAG: ribonuclease E/G [Alphaproteobacteria bacterium PRO2]|nr:ribonuclease E/G [Alphaproteobacteria bacterium PRO2]
MTRKMLIDATHDEETRVAVVDGRKLVEFDYESKFRKPLKGSIFLAKVTRVEPSLQAAFVNFGGNRHGFLPFAEIHPDYFRIPIADREALLAEQQAMIEAQEAAEREREQQDMPAEAAEAPAVQAQDESEDNVEYLEREDETIEEIGGVEGGKTAAAADEHHHDEPAEEQPHADEFQPHEEGDHAAHADEGPQEESMPQGEGQEDEPQEGEQQEGEGNNRGGRHRYPRRGRRGGGRGRHRMAHRSGRVEKFGGEDYSQEDRFRFNLRRKYKIQEVIKRGQIMLVQVSKEERGNKGAAVSTYLSLPGRYCVLMPNSPRAGGVSRKIANYQDRARMKEIMQEITVPTGMSVIVRTAGVSRTKPEINRDLDYLMRLWDNIRELTLQSSAPSKVYEEADLIKRAVRDLYGKDIEQIVVAGEEGYKTAKNFMKMMIPSHVKNVIEHTDDVPLFTRYHVEEQIAEIGEARVTLPSGGYLIINQTEALVAVDVNSGKATKERHIEETALKTNMEAASEIARQLRLRDLGGLIVIDFIDMEDRRNNSKVERRVREALSTDRARIQMSRISSFGLMELSRQRLNPSLTESQFEICPHCAGLGRIRTADAMSILVLRAIEAEGIKGRKGQQLIAHVSNDVAVYILNNKRKNVSEIETRYGMNILIRVDETLGASSFRIEAIKGSGNVDDDTQEREIIRTETTHRHDDHHHDDAADAHADEEHHDEDDPGAGPRHSDHGDDPREDRPERSGRRRGRRGGKRRGRREWRDNDNRVESQDDSAGQDFNAPQDNFGEEDEFRDAAAHQASHDRYISRDPDEQQHQRGRGRGEQGREGRGGRGGRNRHRGGRGRNNNNGNGRYDSGRDGNREGNRAPRDDGNAQPQQRPQQNSAPRGESFQPEAPTSFEAPREPREAARPAPKPYEKKEHEKLNEAPSEKKRGWWNRLTE